MIEKTAVAMRMFERYVARRQQLGDPPKVTQWSLLPKDKQEVWLSVADLWEDEVKAVNQKLEQSELAYVNLRRDHDAGEKAYAAMADDCISAVNTVGDLNKKLAEPVPMHLWCPVCATQHLDVGEFATRLHKTHTCQGCGFCWMPSLRPTVGVRFLPGTENAATPPGGPVKVRMVSCQTTADEIIQVLQPVDGGPPVTFTMRRVS